MGRIKRPGVGVAGLLWRPSNDNDDGWELLLGLRIGGLEAGKWGVPGGHVEYGERPEISLEREIYEECGLQVGLLDFEAVTNDFMPDDEAHYFTLFFNVNSWTGDVCLKEPDKCSEWRWFNREEYITLPLASPIDNLLKETNVYYGVE